MVNKSFRSIASKIGHFGVLGAFVIGSVQPVFADSHLPILDITPESSFTTTEDGFNSHGGPKNPAATNGDIQINGTATLPITKALSISYDRISLGTFDSNLSSIIVGGNTIYPGGSRDVLQNYRADYHVGRFNVEGGFGSRKRSCCPVDSFDWHKGFLGVSYTTPSLIFLNHGFFVFDITGNSSHQYVSPQALARIPPGLSFKNNSQNYTTQQAVTAVIPVDLRNGVRVAGTFLWGALDYPVDYPFPLYYDVFVISGTKQVNPNFGVTINLTNVIQRNQGYPFPSPLGIRTSALNVLADIHLDFNRLLHPAPPVTPGRPTQPGAPGGPGGPAQVGPTQGGTVSPAPGASPAPATPGAPAASAAPEAPAASAAPVDAGGTGSYTVCSSLNEPADGPSPHRRSASGNRSASPLLGWWPHSRSTLRRARVLVDLCAGNQAHDGFHIGIDRRDRARMRAVTKDEDAVGHVEELRHAVAD